MDVMDISGEHQTDLEHDITKTRLSREGRAIESRKAGSESHLLMTNDEWSTGDVKLKVELQGDVERANLNRDPNYCGSCYGASPAENGSVLPCTSASDLISVDVATLVKKCEKPTSAKGGLSPIQTVSSNAWRKAGSTRCKSKIPKDAA